MKTSDTVWFAGGLVGGALVLGAAAYLGLVSLEPTVPTGPRPPIIIKGSSLSFAREDEDFPLEPDASSYKYIFKEVAIDHLDGTLDKLENNPQHFPHISKIEFSGTGTPNCSVSLVAVDDKHYLVVESDKELKKKSSWGRDYWEHPNGKLPEKLTVTFQDGERSFDVRNRPFEFWLDY